MIKEDSEEEIIEEESEYETVDELEAIEEGQSLDPADDDYSEELVEEEEDAPTDSKKKGWSLWSSSKKPKVSESSTQERKVDPILLPQGRPNTEYSPANDDYSEEVVEEEEDAPKDFKKKGWSLWSSSRKPKVSESSKQERKVDPVLLPQGSPDAEYSEESAGEDYGIDTAFPTNDTFQETDEEDPSLDSDDVESGLKKKARKTEASQKEIAIPKWRLWAIVVVILLIGIGVGAGIGVAAKKGDGDSPSESDSSGGEAAEPTAAPVTNDLKETFDFVCEAFPNNCEALRDSSSPQFQAVRWLNDNENFDSFSDAKKLTRYALATFYYSTQGDSWIDNTNWVTDADECEWYSSVERTCTEALEVVTDDFVTYLQEPVFSALELDLNNVQGVIPPEVSLLVNLTSFSIRSSEEAYVIGGLPSELGNLTKLISVSLTDNSLSGEIPSSYGSWVDIETLDLSGNGLSGEFPTSFSSFASLQVLRLANNQLTGKIPSSLLAAATDLTELSLETNQLSGIIPASIGGLSSLETLNLGSNDFAGGFPLQVTQLTNLGTLDVSENKLGGQIPVEIGNLVNLKGLYLQGSNFRGTIPTEIGNLINLRPGLDLSNNILTGAIPSELGQLVKLRKLYLNSNFLRGGLPEELAAIDKIQVIRIDDNSLTGSVPDSICQLYDRIEPASYADCDEISAPCFIFCCTDGAECQCRFENTDPILCLKAV